MTARLRLALVLGAAALLLWRWARRDRLGLTDYASA